MHTNIATFFLILGGEKKKFILYRAELGRKESARKTLCCRFLKRRWRTVFARTYGFPLALENTWY